MWDATALSPRLSALVDTLWLKFAVSHISQKTSEMWGTQRVHLNLRNPK
jgi:hypothetical protein